ncbi:UBX domain-containing protein [Babesia caballi]|uniref:ubiquitinyl hydrolase 1 n=1 Tax=Babesia caballi TaxID=5871 RepID=A0AAV4M0H4_BABCB|nr:UBX domain-containing protein [Babesia caballi]
MSNIRSFGDFPEEPGDRPFSFAGGQNSAIGIEKGHIVHLYSGGFTVDDGPFRSLDDPENALFLSSVKHGVAPPEFQASGDNVRVYFIDESHRQYEPPQSHVSSAVSRPREAAVPTNICIGTNDGPTTVLRVKLFDNRQINLTVSQDITIGELRSIVAEQSGLIPPAFRLLCGFPPREITGDDSETLAEKALLGCAIFQHLVN